VKSLIRGRTGINIVARRSGVAGKDAERLAAWQAEEAGKPVAGAHTRRWSSLCTGRRNVCAQSARLTFSVPGLFTQRNRVRVCRCLPARQQRVRQACCHLCALASRLKSTLPLTGSPPRQTAPCADLSADGLADLERGGAACFVKDLGSRNNASCTCDWSDAECKQQRVAILFCESGGHTL